jgi:type I restriction enzyme S subunit
VSVSPISGWGVKRLKYAASINDEALPESTSPGFELQYIDIGNVDSNGAIHDIVTYAFENAPSRARRIVKHGDVIISTVRTYLQAIAAIENPPESLIVSTGFAVVRPNTSLHPRFCKYALREPSFLHEVISRSFGISYPAINASELGDIRIPLPSFDQQEQVADFLDRETARIDSLLAAKENHLTLIAEKRRALITTAVTRSIDPTVLLKESGIPWLGPVPEHWEIERAKWLFKERDIRSEFGDEEMLTVSHITGVTTRAEKSVNMFMAENQEGSKICEAGDLVINTLWAWMGAMGVSPQRGIVSPAYNVYEPGDRLDKAYLDYLVRMPVFAQEAIRYSKGVWSSRLRLYPEGLYEIWLPVPPVEEQRAIAEHLNTETAKLDALKAATERTIALLRERRSALIAAAVTGGMPII